MLLLCPWKWTLSSRAGGRLNHVLVKTNTALQAQVESSAMWTDIWMWRVPKLKWALNFSGANTDWAWLAWARCKAWTVKAQLNWSWALVVNGSTAKSMAQRLILLSFLFFLVLGLFRLFPLFFCWPRALLLFFLGSFFFLVSFASAMLHLSSILLSSPASLLFICIYFFCRP